MRTQLFTTLSGVALAAATDQASAETKAEQKKEPFSLDTITKQNSKQVAQEIWARIQGYDEKGKPSDKFADRKDALQELLGALRDVRDNDDNRVTRPKKELEVILREALNKPLGELQTARVNLMGIPTNIPTLVRIATSVAKEGEAPHPMKAAAVSFMKEHKLTVKEQKSEGSRGRKTTYLVEANKDNGTIDKLAA